MNIPGSRKVLSRITNRWQIPSLFCSADLSAIGFFLRLGSLTVKRTNGATAKPGGEGEGSEGVRRGRDGWSKREKGNICGYLFLRIFTHDCLFFLNRQVKVKIAKKIVAKENTNRVIVQFAYNIFPCPRKIFCINS